MKYPMKTFSTIAMMGLALAACKKDEMEDMSSSNNNPNAGPAIDPSTAPRVSVDRFSMDAGHLFVRDGSNGLPGANAPIDFDQAPFITMGLGPNGEHVEYYNFDVMPTTPAPIWVLFREGASDPVSGQLNIIDKIPGESGYNDLWQVYKVTVPSDYVANSVTSRAEIAALGYMVQPQTLIVNCPIVPDGSTAMKRLNGESNALVQCWYQDQVGFYFNFSEHTLMGPPVPTSPIYVTFNINPDQPDGGPPSGFVTEMGNMQTHNVIATLPADMTYSPLWNVQIYDNANFSMVSDLSSAQMANILVNGAALVNCPVVSVQ
ncbi:MAG: hypothetical protein H6595_04120 [Flavobacteriales bacterium]|nr:hypothetical protein [Flavobacteriales bacterium]MCB9166645.1 hypothetical protein [Flavobacteriales bacterium]